MGIDINIYAERRQADGSFALVSGMRPNHDFFLGGDEHYPNEDSPPWPPLIPQEALDLVCNYALFAILANVQNGVRTANQSLVELRTTNKTFFEVIASPRGLPADLSPELKECAGQWGDDLTSPSWFSLEEIINFPWKQPVDYGADWKAKIAVRVAAQWLETYEDIANTNEFFEKLSPLVDLGNPVDTRLVFWFDY